MASADQTSDPQSKLTCSDVEAIQQEIFKDLEKFNAYLRKVETPLPEERHRKECHTKKIPDPKDFDDLIETLRRLKALTGSHVVGECQCHCHCEHCNCHPSVERSVRVRQNPDSGYGSQVYVAQETRNGHETQVNTANADVPLEGAQADNSTVDSETPSTTTQPDSPSEHDDTEDSASSVTRRPRQGRPPMRNQRIQPDEQHQDLQTQAGSSARIRASTNEANVLDD